MIQIKKYFGGFGGAAWKGQVCTMKRSIQWLVISVFATSAYSSISCSSISLCSPAANLCLWLSFVLIQKKQKIKAEINIAKNTCRYAKQKTTRCAQTTFCFTLHAMRFLNVKFCEADRDLPFTYHRFFDLFFVIQKINHYVFARGEIN